MSKNNEKENVHAGHRSRMRERFLKEGISGFSAHEILEMLLYYTIPRANTNETAHRLLKEFDSMRGVFLADYKELMRVPGVGESSACFLHLLGSVYHQMETEQISELPLHSFENRFAYYHSLLDRCREEHLLVTCLSDDLKAIKSFTVSKGTPGKVQAEPQTLVRLVLSVPCNQVMLAHNHPAATKAYPSDQDVFFNHQIAKILRSLSIDLVDHIIVAGDHACSMREIGCYDPGML